MDGRDVLAGVPQGSILSPLFYFFLIYVKNLPDNLTSNSKLFTNNKLFSAVTDSNASANQYQ